MKITNKLILVLGIFLLCCTNQEHKSALMAVNRLEKLLTKSQISSLKNHEKGTMMEDHYFYLRLVKDSILNDPKNDSLVLKYFIQNDIHDQDEMSAIIISSLYRKLNSEPLNIHEQIKELDTLKKSRKEIERLNIARAKNLYRDFEIGDTLTLRMQISPYGSLNATEYGNPAAANSIFSDQRDFLISGVLIGKSSESETYSFKFIVINSNKPDEEVLSNKLVIGDTMHIDLERNIIEREY